MGGDLDHDLLAVRAGGQQALFVLRRAGFAADIVQALRLEQALDQFRAELGADGVGTLDAQHGLSARLGGEERKGQGVAGEAEEQQGERTAPEIAIDARHAEGTF